MGVHTCIGFPCQATPNPGAPRGPPGHNGPFPPWCPVQQDGRPSPAASHIRRPRDLRPAVITPPASAGNRWRKPPPPAANATTPTDWTVRSKRRSRQLAAFHSCTAAMMPATTRSSLRSSRSDCQPVVALTTIRSSSRLLTHHPAMRRTANRPLGLGVRQGFASLAEFSGHRAAAGVRDATNYLRRRTRVRCTYGAQRLHLGGWINETAGKETVRRAGRTR